MALRVLLADESSTIKKVMQLALQDFAVEVKAVPIGLDVLPVTKNFKPDIVFVDVLLTKKSGYDVCGDLKNDPDTRSLPVVLMWSSFMELDEQKFTQCQANGRLEKPFDADSLRHLVEDLVVKTKAHPTSAYVSFPPLPEFEESAQAVQEEGPQHELSQPEAALHEIPSVSEVDLQEIDLDLPSIEMESAGVSTTSDTFVAPMPEETSHDEDEGWTRQDLTKFKIQLPVEEDNFASKFVIPQDDLEPLAVSESADFQEITFSDSKKPPLPTAASSTPNSASGHFTGNDDKGIDKSQVERIIREEAQAAIESIAWRILPEIAERVVREEIQKLLRETENSL